MGFMVNLLWATLPMAAIVEAESPAAINIGARKQLFFDHKFIDHSETPFPLLCGKARVGLFNC